ncbi:retinoic acid early transcript 1E-like [Erinaceus europaeus]|uniref:Retinoic acid early transcript 1E-like n=1 Tax=Erinaceus europaeus TaxID=9365 RepID=A0ABM3YJS7_ERIEU|nr:retinoic acid early transcript 1E-like [Erinaceus europaeus]
MKLKALTAGLGLILLLMEVLETLGGVHFLCLKFTVSSYSSPLQPWSKVKGSVDGKPFIEYDSYSNNVTAVGRLGKEVNNTKAWRNLAKSLESIGRKVRIIMRGGLKQEKILNKRVPSLQAQLCCQQESEQCTSASWEFNINGQRALINTVTMTWTVLDPETRMIKEEWAKKQDLAEELRNVSIQDCNHWLKEFLEHWEKMLDGTDMSSKAKETIQHYPSTWLITWIMPIITILSYLKFS